MSYANRSADQWLPVPQEWGGGPPAQRVVEGFPPPAFT